MSECKKVLFVHYGDDWIRGSEQTLINLVSHLDKRRFHAVIWTNSPALHHRLKNQNAVSMLDKFTLLFGWRRPKFSVTNWFRLIWKARRLIQEHQIDIIHVNSGAPVQWMLPVAKLCGVPMVTHLHCDYPKRDRYTLGLHFSPFSVVVSKAISHSLLRDGYPKHKLAVIPNGIDIDTLNHTATLDTKAHLGLKPEAFLFVTLGSLIRRKGIDRLIDAVQLLHQKSKRAHLLVIGDGEQKQALINKVNRLDLADSVHFVGEQQNPISWLKGGCDAFISGARHEAFGLVIAEAGLANLPIIAPNIDGIPEVVCHNHSAVLYEPDSISNTVSAMERVIHSKPLRLWLGANAAKRVVQQFSVTTQVRAFEKLYTRIISKQITLKQITSKQITSKQVTSKHTTQSASIGAVQEK